jgi:hypothetical protein
LYVHKRLCKNENSITEQPPSESLVEYLIKENQEFKNLILEVLKNGSMNNSHNTTNSHNKSFNLTQIFCPPGDLPVTGDLTNQILDSFIARNNFKPTDEIPIILIFALKNAYPCR